MNSMPITHPLIAALLVALLVPLAGCGSREPKPPAPPTEDRRLLPRLSVPKLGIPRVHKIGIQQGNVLTQEMVDRLRPGMTRRQVLYVLGQPVVANTFRDDVWNYVYTFKPGYGEMTTQHLNVYFDGDLLTSFSGDFKASEETEETTEEGAAEGAEETTSASAAQASADPA